ILIACIAVASVASATTEKPLVRCPRVICAMFCLDGFKTDASGCPICACQEPATPICATPMCANPCSNGYKKSPEGCDTCEC
ncbi:hypothetical protein CAPTEDRAFT_59745, partial [Capitella teleta]